MSHSTTICLVLFSTMERHRTTSQSRKV
jgi:hypothetical protein